MSIELSWDNEDHTALVYRFPENWTWDQFYTIKVNADKLLDKEDHRVVLIFDMRSTHSIPSGVLFQARTLISRAHPRGRPIVLVGSSLVIQAMLNLVARFNSGLGELIKIAPSVEEARAYIKKNDWNGQAVNF